MKIGHYVSQSCRAVLTGKRSDWVLDGTASAERFELGDYTLARVAGPARLASRNGEFSIKTDLAGHGGAGAGAYASLLGAQPKATADIAHLKEGRWLFRRVNVVGAGLTVDGSGARGLLGGLNFNGDVTLTNLAAIGPQAKGRLTAKLDASQARGGEPWKIALDGRGDGFASGLAEADRLLGPKPALALRTVAAAPSTTCGTRLACQCDAGFFGTDCSQRVCPTGDDPLTLCDSKNQGMVQEIRITLGSQYKNVNKA